MASESRVLSMMALSRVVTLSQKMQFSHNVTSNGSPGALYHPRHDLNRDHHRSLALSGQWSGSSKHGVNICPHLHGTLPPLLPGDWTITCFPILHFIICEEDARFYRARGATEASLVGLGD